MIIAESRIDHDSESNEINIIYYLQKIRMKFIIPLYLYIV